MIHPDFIFISQIYILFKIQNMKPMGNAYQVRRVIQTQQIKTFKGFDAKSQTSVDMTKNDSDMLLMKILMLGIEIDRKDHVINELLAQNVSQIQIHQLTNKISRQEYEIKTSYQSIQMMKNQIIRYEKEVKDLQAYQSRAQFNSELQEKVMNLDAKLKKSQEEGIQLKEMNTKLKMDLSMKDCQIMNFKSKQNSKINQLENVLNNFKIQLDSEKKTNIEKNVIIQRLTYDLNQAKRIRFQLEGKMRIMQSEYNSYQTLKKSQISEKQEKVTQISQEIGRLSQQNKNLRQAIDNLRYDLQNRDNKIQEGASAYKELESTFNRLQTSYKQITFKYESREKQTQFKDREVGEKQSIIKKLQNDNDELRRIFSIKIEESNSHVIQITNSKNYQIKLLSDQLANLQTQIRKLKRKPMAQSILCQNCRLKEVFSSKSINSMSSIKNGNNVNLAQIIQSTEELQKSTKRIDSLITPVLIESKTIIHRSFHEIK